MPKKGATKGVEQPLGTVDTPGPDAPTVEELLAKSKPEVGAPEAPVASPAAEPFLPELRDPSLADKSLLATEVQDPSRWTQTFPAVKESQPFTIDMAKINKELLFRMCYALVMNQPQNFIGVPGSRRIGLILGATTTKAQLEAWQEVKDFINGINKAKSEAQS